MSSPFTADFDALAVGDRFVTRGRTITETDVVQFAAYTGDMHPLHTDARWAAQSRFGGRVAHGMLVLSYALGLVPLDPDRVVALRRVADAVFKEPVRIGDTIHVEGKIEAVKALDGDHGLVASQWRVVSDAGALVARARVELLMRRGPAAHGSAGDGPAAAGTAAQGALRSPGVAT